jgi:hypothetical protein
MMMTGSALLGVLVLAVADWGDSEWVWVAAICSSDEWMSLFEFESHPNKNDMARTQSDRQVLCWFTTQSFPAAAVCWWTKIAPFNKRGEDYSRHKTAMRMMMRLLYVPFNSFCILQHYQSSPVIIYQIPC